MDEEQPEAETKSKLYRGCNIPAMIKALWKRHRRSKPLKEAPGFRASFLTIVKTSCEHQALLGLLAVGLVLTFLVGPNLGLNVLLIFIPLSVRLSFTKSFAEYACLIRPCSGYSISSSSAIP
jgi:hypothetical protein